jgi:hypothetical protein
MVVVLLLHELSDELTDFFVARFREKKAFLVEG